MGAIGLRVAAWVSACIVLWTPGAGARGPESSRTPVTGNSPFRTDEFAGWFHDAGNVLLHVSNRGMFGRAFGDGTSPSGEWPAGSNNEYLWAAGLWVGGVIQRSGVQDTLVSAGLYQSEYFNFENDEGCGSPPVGICNQLPFCYANDRNR